MKRALLLARGACLSLIASSGVLLDASHASACGETPCAQPEESLPADSSAGVPTNVEVRVGFTGFAGDGQADCEPLLSELRIEPRDGEGVNVVGARLKVDGTAYPMKWIVADLEEELLPNTRYSVLSRVSPTGQCACEGDPAFGAWHTVGDFITGDGPDDEAPALDEDAISLHYGELQNGDNSCGPFHSFTMELGAPSAPEGAARQVRYNLYLDGRPHLTYVEGNKTFLIQCFEDGSSTERYVAEGRELEVRGVDLAGNESETGKIFELRDLCAEESETGGGYPVDGGDSGDATVVPAGPTNSGEASGCSASATSPTYAGLWLLALLARRRRRGTS